MLYNVVMKKHLTIKEVSELLDISKETLRRWDAAGKLVPKRHPINKYRIYDKAELEYVMQLELPSIDQQDTDSPSPFDEIITPIREYKSIELFAGAGGLAIGLEHAGLNTVLLNEIDKYACETLRKNRPQWNVVEASIAALNFEQYRGQVDVVTGGFPCQAFSFAGKKLGFDDARGTLFYEFARAVKEIQPLIAIGENVRGLLSHENGKTLNGMVSVLEELGYDVLLPRVLKATKYMVPQKRERLILVAIRKGTNITFEYPKPCAYEPTLRDALKEGVLYDCDVPYSSGQLYPKSKEEVLQLVPPGGYWRDLPIDIQKQYMQKSYYLGGGKTGMARRISWDEPSLTLTCAPAQKQTERCHPDHTRPFTVREYARIQTFPDDWVFAGSMTQQYKQIGNAVPVNLAYAIGKQIVKALNGYYENYGKK
jgi:DNA (cytosine-5)-methyltransferase 1